MNSLIDNHDPRQASAWSADLGTLAASMSRRRPALAPPGASTTSATLPIRLADILRRVRPRSEARQDAQQDLHIGEFVMSR